MTADFETWAMRGLVLGLMAIVGTMILLRWKNEDQREDKFNAALDSHRTSTEAALKEFRTEFMNHLDRLRASNEASMNLLNKTMAEVASTAGDIRTRMAERYVTKEEMAALEARIEKRFELCSEANCPIRNG